MPEAPGASRVPDHPQHPWIDVSQAPLYIVTYPQRASDDAIQRAHAEVERFYQMLDHEVGWLLDCRQVKEVSAQQRALLAEHETHTARYAARYNVGLAFVVDSGVVRGIITAVMWMAPPAYPYRVLTDYDSAHRWVRRQLYGHR